MAWDGWIEFGGEEFINIARTTQLAEAMGIDSVWVDSDEVSWIAGALGEASYDDVTKAPWYDAGFPASAEFAGILPLSMQGLGDSTLTSTPVEYTGDGGNSGRSRNATLPIVASVAIVAKTRRGADYGKRWMDRRLRGEVNTTFCSGVDLRYFRYGSSDSPMAHYRDVKLTRGSSITRKRNTDCSSIWLVTFTWTAADPYEYGDGIDVFTGLGSSWPNGSKKNYALNPTMVSTGSTHERFSRYSATLSWQTGSGLASGPDTYARSTETVSSAGERGFDWYRNLDLGSPGHAINLIKNSDFESGTTGWSPFTGGALSRDTTEHHSGTASLKCVVSAAYGGVACALPHGGAPGTSDENSVVPSYLPGKETAAIWVKAAAGTNLRIRTQEYLNNVVQTPEPAFQNFTGTGDWQEVTFTATKNNPASFNRVEIQSPDASATFWIDDVRLTHTPSFIAVESMDAPGSTDQPVTPGETITLSAFVRGNIASQPASMYYFVSRLHDGWGNWFAERANGPFTVVNNGQWSRIDCTLTIPTTVSSQGTKAAYLAVGLRTNRSAITVGDTIDQTGLIVERSGSPSPVFPNGSLVLTQLDCPAYDYDPIYDPLYPALVPSPTAPNLIPDGWSITTGSNFERYWARIDATEPVDLSMVPIITLTSTEEARMVRVSIWPSDSQTDDQCDPLFCAVVSYLPAGVQFVIDGEQKAAYVWDGVSPVVRRADSLVYAPDASPVKWTAFDNPDGLLVTLDAFADSDGYEGSGNIRASLTLVPKSD